MQVAATISAVVAIGVAILAVLALRDLPYDPGAGPEEPLGPTPANDREHRRGIQPAPTPVPET